MAQIKFGAVKNFNELDTGTKILIYIMLKHDREEIDVPKPKIADDLNISRQTLGKYLQTFVTCNILKYKYSGKMRLNPDFYYSGKPEDFERVKNGYQTFRSDI